MQGAVGTIRPDQPDPHRAPLPAASGRWLAHPRPAFCAATSAATLLGVGLNAWAGWRRADPVAGLVIAGLAVKEGLEAFEDHD
jgi:hypothetical protein